MTEVKYVIGMDCGTTNIKAIILNSEGKMIAEASRSSKFIISKDNYHEQDANEWWFNACSIFKDLKLQVPKEVFDNIVGICISSHTVSMLPLDEEGKPLRNAITYQDGRSFKEMEEILDKVGHGRYCSIVGSLPSVAFLPSKLLWYKRYEGELFNKTSSIVQANSYINYRLTGVLSQDIDQATRTQCLDINKLAWSDEIGQALEVDLDRILPKIYKVDDIIGEVTKDASKETGLKEGIIVLAGSSDAMAAMYATGINKLGEAGESSGTTSLVFVTSKTRNPDNIVIATRPVNMGEVEWIYDAPIQTSGAAIKWYIDTFAHEENETAELLGKDIYTFLNEIALGSNPGSNGLIFFPYLLGERAPLWNSHASGMFIGLSTNTKRCDLIRSVLEGTAFALRHVIETVKQDGVEIKSLRICGGGAKSWAWNKIKASILGIPVLVLDEGSGDVPLGDALIIAHKVGFFDNLEEAVSKIVKVKEVVEPDMEWKKMYDKIYPFYISMYNNLDRDLYAFKNVMVK